MEYTTIKLTIDGAVATLTLNRPDALNAMNPEMMAELNLAADEVEGQPDLKALVIRGEGRAFCAGADLGSLDQAFDAPPSLRRILEDVNAFYFRLEDLTLPVIALVHGYALAGG